MNTSASSRDGLDLRTLSDPEWTAASELIETVFHEVPVVPEVRAAERSTFELDRTVGAFDGDLLVGLTAAYSMRMTVPGGHQVPMAGVTWVAVRPTHRRRGILNRLMRRQLEDIHSGGREAVAALYASETPIYGRFGYGLASHAADMSILRTPDPLAGAPVDPSLRLRVLPPDESLPLVEPIYAAMVASRPGMLSRDKGWAERAVLDAEALRRGATRLQCLLAEDDAGPRGYAWYSTVGEWNDASLPEGTVRVRETGALDPAAYAAVWRYLLNIDLTIQVETRLPVDDPLLHLLADPRRARPRVKDGLFVRLVDVGRALAERRYACEVDVVLDVADPGCPWNQRRWRLVGGPDGASCEPTDAPADLALSARELGAAHLGGVSLRTLGQAGRVSELRPGRLTAASRAFLSDVQPFATFTF
jgi:predicted acetyltransferase